ncbi:hypothetical protein RD792_003567 [Penstemon davidsonii]|uniref:Poly(A) RNA polymerase mitochondrial-like central palm domain-containing protein n=1 Tax=Penstemon davidsonii TaxID=160366 RepID=A0ABR0DF31_9LAMI|nr:hypothetical protein RD792_003567 [Penstemon davidsonii]
MTYLISFPQNLEIGATVEPFGSFVSNLFTRWGDLDISLEVPNGSYISNPGRKHKQTLLGDVLRVLRKKAGCRRLQFISNARVPILKFEGSHNISCDISVNNLSGQMKSKMLFWINEIDGRFRDLVKEWAKAYHINDSKSVFRNVVIVGIVELMIAVVVGVVVGYLLTLVPAILPPLKEIYPGNMIDDLTDSWSSLSPEGVRAAAEKHIEDTCAVNINRIMSDKSRLINQSSLSELFISFLTKFSVVCSRASTHGVSPYAGQLEDIDSNMRWLPKTYALFVEDPFEQPANTARTVSSNQLTNISEAIGATYQMLVSPNQNQASIVSVLVGPHISRFLVRAPMPNPLITQSVRTRNGFKTHPGKSKTLLQTNQQSQNNNMEKKRGGTSKPNLNMDNNIDGTLNLNRSRDGTTNGSSQASTSQKKQVWKPRSDTKLDQSSFDS